MFFKTILGIFFVIFFHYSVADVFGETGGTEKEENESHDKFDSLEIIADLDVNIAEEVPDTKKRETPYELPERVDLEIFSERYSGHTGRKKDDRREPEARRQFRDSQYFHMMLFEHILYHIDVLVGNAHVPSEFSDEFLSETVADPIPPYVADKLSQHKRNVGWYEG